MVQTKAQTSTGNTKNATQESGCESWKEACGKSPAVQSKRTLNRQPTAAPWHEQERICACRWCIHRHRHELGKSERLHQTTGQRPRWADPASPEEMIKIRAAPKTAAPPNHSLGRRLSPFWLIIRVIYSHHLV